MIFNDNNESKELQTQVKYYHDISGSRSSDGYGTYTFISLSESEMTYEFDDNIKSYFDVSISDDGKKLVFATKKENDSEHILSGYCNMMFKDNDKFTSKVKLNYNIPYPYFILFSDDQNKELEFSSNNETKTLSTSLDYYNANGGWTASDGRKYDVIRSSYVVNVTLDENISEYFTASYSNHTLTFKTKKGNVSGEDMRGYCHMTITNANVDGKPEISSDTLVASTIKLVYKG